LAVFAFVLLTSAASAQKGVVIGLVEVETIVASMDEAKKAEADLKDLQKIYADSLKKMEDDFMKKVEAYQKQKSMMAPDKQQKEEETLPAQQQRLYALREELSNAIVKKREELLDPIREKVKAAIESVAKEEKINIVLDKNNSIVMYSESQFDITHRVIDKLKRNK